MILLGLLKVAQFLVNHTQVVVTSCHLYILRSSLFLCNTQPVKLRLKHNKPPAKRAENSLVLEMSLSYNSIVAKLIGSTGPRGVARGVRKPLSRTFSKYNSKTNVLI